MKHSLEEIKKMLAGVEYWPVLEIGAQPISVDTHQIISDLVQEVESLQSLLESIYYEFQHLIQPNEKNKVTGPNEDYSEG